MSDQSVSRLLNPSVSHTPKPKSNKGLIVGIIVLSVVVVILIVVVIIIALLKKKATTTTTGNSCATDSDCGNNLICSNGKCAACSLPSTPSNVALTYDSLARTATLTWTAVSTATSYNIYSKLEDPSVSPSNYTTVDSVTTTTKTYTTLDYGTHYYVVTAVNTCGQSLPSSPVVFAPACQFLPAVMPAPTVTQTNNDCAGSSASDIVSVSFMDMSATNGVYVVRGTGQKGNISPYLYLVQGDAFGPASGIHLTCGGVSTTHTVTQITDVTNANIVAGAPVSGNTYTVKWNPVAGAEEYVVMLVGVEIVTGLPHFYGGYAPANATSLTLDTNNNDTIVFEMVLGYRICNKSPTSAITTYVTP